MALPGLVEHEAILRLGVAMQDRLMEHGLAVHGIEHAGEEVEKRLPLVGMDVESDQIGDGHGGTPVSSVIPAKAGIQGRVAKRRTCGRWIPAFAGMTARVWGCLGGGSTT